MQLIHRYWTGAGPAPNEWIKKTIEDLNIQKVKDWTDKDLPAQIIQWLDDHKQDVLPENQVRHRANMVRLWLLYKYGGWWVDYDVIMLKPFRDLPFPAIASHGKTACTCVMGFPKNHPVLGVAMRSIGKADKSTEASGERLVTKVMEYLPDYTVTRLKLPFTPRGEWTGAEPWGIHLYNTSKERI